MSGGQEWLAVIYRWWWQQSVRDNGSGNNGVTCSRVRRKNDSDISGVSRLAAAMDWCLVWGSMLTIVRATVVMVIAVDQVI